MTREEQAKKNRELMPQVAAWVDEYRQWGVTVIYANENGVVVGKPPIEKNVFTVPANYFPNFRIKSKEQK